MRNSSLRRHRALLPALAVLAGPAQASDPSALMELAIGALALLAAVIGLAGFLLKRSTRPSIRAEAPADVEAIEAVTLAAFRTAEHSNGQEQAIVRRLRQAGALSVSLVAERGGAILGHVAVSPVRLSGGEPDWFGLGPVSVHPHFQRKGIGRRLVAQALDELRARGATGCVVLGDPAYYRRFGFAAMPGLVLPGVPPQYFQAVAFSGDVPDGDVSYHAAFDS